MWLQFLGLPDSPPRALSNLLVSYPILQVGSWCAECGGALLQPVLPHQRRLFSLGVSNCSSSIHWCVTESCFSVLLWQKCPEVSSVIKSSLKALVKPVDLWCSGLASLSSCVWLESFVIVQTEEQAFFLVSYNTVIMGTISNVTKHCRNA